MSPLSFLKVRGRAGLATGAAVLLVGAVAPLVRATQSRDSSDWRRLPVSSPVAPRHVILVAHARDCDSRLGFAHVFERPGIRVRFEGLVILDENDAPMTRAPMLDDLRLKTIGPRIDYQRMLGGELRRSPALVFYGPDRKLQMVVQAPLSTESAEALVRWVAGGAE